MIDMNIWKRKLVAYLHDPPHKPRSIAAHEDLRTSFLAHLNIAPEALMEFDRSHDWQAAAADRMVFPNPAKSGLSVDWEASGFEFHHPLGGGRLAPTRFPSTTAGLEAAFDSALDGIAPDSENWKLKFIRSWRLWPERSAREKAAHLAYLVADTRIPDHTLWHHNALAAAFTAAGDKPAFLLFQIGPVQDFIAQARKTQDLWSASYLLSFLITRAMLAVADRGKLADGTEIEGIGPDSIIYPQLRGAPLADWHWWTRGFFGSEPKQKLRASHANELLTPNLPNRFLALVPAGESGHRLAQAAEKAVRDSWQAIADSVHDFVEAQVGNKCPGWDDHWQSQVGRVPVVDWVVHDWTDTESALKQAEKNTPPFSGGWEAHPLHHAFLWATQMIPSAERENYGPYSNPGFVWALHYEATAWKFAARKATRSFAPWTHPGATVAEGVPKDHLDGRNEVLGGTHHAKFREALNDQSRFQGEFKGFQLYGALSVIKRLWPRCYLRDELHWEPWRPSFDSVQDIARAIDREEDDAAVGNEPTYYAVLCMDGDDMGQWVSGVQAAPLVNSLAEDAVGYFKKYWDPAAKHPSADAVKRPLSPGYHAALSEALANFSLYCAGPVVRAFAGQLLYAGGDDVMAMVPSNNALDCAQALQITFRGIHPDSVTAHASGPVRDALKEIFDFDKNPEDHPAGFLTLRRTEHAGVGRAENLKPNWPLMVMGPKATVSAGIAIGHVRAPMQDTIQAARDAEHAAKAVPGKSAFCLNILKRSGESALFAAKWESGVVGVWAELSSGVLDQTGRFAYRYLQLIRPLLASTAKGNDEGWERQWTSDLRAAVEAELIHVLKQQANQVRTDAVSNANRWIGALIGENPSQPILTPRHFIHFWMAWAFVNRLDDQP